jgi:ribose transport system substrate-binding protein
VLLLELARAGSLLRARMRGVVAGIKETLREVEGRPFVSLDGDGQFKTSLERVRKHLRESKTRHVLVGAANDPSALGAARAFQEVGRATTCAIVGQNAEPDVRVELREPRSPLVGSVGYFPEKYGDGLLRLALDILGGKPVPPAVFVRHHLITPDNVDHFYPNDVLMGMESTTRF